MRSVVLFLIIIFTLLEPILSFSCGSNSDIKYYCLQVASEECAKMREEKCVLDKTIHATRQALREGEAKVAVGSCRK